MTRAMMEVYNQELAANPQSYEVYFRRANEYYKFNQYLRALSDVDNAIKYAPATDTEFLFEARFSGRRFTRCSANTRRRLPISPRL